MSEERKRLVAEALRLTDPSLLLPASMHERQKHAETVQGMARPLAHALLQSEEELDHFRATIREAESLMHEQKQEIERLQDEKNTLLQAARQSLYLLDGWGELSEAYRELERAITEVIERHHEKLEEGE